MVYLIYGARNTGKSAYYERLLAEKREKKVYFATLWSDINTQSTIDKHMKRRGTDWILVESNGDCDKDREKIIKVIDDIGLPINIMIDGITNWCRFCSQANAKYLVEAERVADSVVKMTNSYPEVTWFLLDSVREDFNMVPVFLEMWDIVNLILKARVENLHVLKWITI